MTLAIMIVMLSIMVFNFSKTDNKTVLSSIAYDVALSARQAQVNSISIKSYGSNSENGYGLHFAAGVTDKYTLFVDKGSVDPVTENIIKGDKQYGGGELIEDVKIPNNYKIKDVCTFGVGGFQGQECLSSGLTSIDAVYWRPDPNAIITNSNGSDYKSKMVITLSAISNEETIKTVTIYQNGQIAISQ